MKRHRLGAGVLVAREGAVLLTHHVRPGVFDYWSPPGGGVHPGEDIESAARREAFEETGLRIEPVRLLYVEQLLGRESGTHHTKLWFQGEIAASDIGKALHVGHGEAVTEMIVEARFVPRAELGGMQVFPDLLLGRYWEDLAGGPGEVRVLSIRDMLFE